MEVLNEKGFYANWTDHDYRDLGALAEVLPFIERVEGDTYNRTVDQFIEGEEAKKASSQQESAPVKQEETK